MSKLQIPIEDWGKTSYLKLDFDPSKYKTVSGAAKAFYRAVCKAAREMGQNPDIEVSLKNPEQNRAYCGSDSWGVVWEAGPYQWGVYASMWGLWNRDAGWWTEPYFSFDVCFVE